MKLKQIFCWLAVNGMSFGECGKATPGEATEADELIKRASNDLLKKFRRLPCGSPLAPNPNGFSALTTLECVRRLVTIEGKTESQSKIGGLKGFKTLSPSRSLSANPRNISLFVPMTPLVKNGIIIPRGWAWDTKSKRLKVLVLLGSASRFTRCSMDLISVGRNPK